MSSNFPTDAACLYRGFVYHRRLRPRVHAFRYRVFSLLLNVDEIANTAQTLRFFSHNRRNIFSFYDADVGELDAAEKRESVRTYVERHLHQNGIFETATSIKLLCYPRIFGYVFNPLAVFYCENAAGELFAVVNEVHNTFGERQVYVLATDSRVDKQAGTFSCAKNMHVSPFTPMQMQYEFTVDPPTEVMQLNIKALDENGLMLIANIAGQRYELSDATLMRCLFGYPLMSVKIILAIHWQALLLWLKQVPWYSHQPKRLPLPYADSTEIKTHKEL